MSPRKSLALAAILLLASGFAATAAAQNKTTDVATVTLSNGGKFKSAPDGTVAVGGTITNNTDSTLMLCGLGIGVDPDTISFDYFTLAYTDLNQSFLIGPGQTVSFAPIRLSVSSGFTRPFFLGDVGAVVSTGGCFGENDVQIPLPGDMFKVKMRD